MVDPFKLHLAITAAIKVNGRDRHRNEGRERDRGRHRGRGRGRKRGRARGRDRGRPRQAQAGKCNAAYTFYYQAANLRVSNNNFVPSYLIGCSEAGGQGGCQRVGTPFLT